MAVKHFDPDFSDKAIDRQKLCEELLVEKLNQNLSAIRKTPRTPKFTWIEKIRWRAKINGENI